MHLKKLLNQDKQIQIMSYPYNFGVIYNFFTPALYKTLCTQFNLWIEKAKTLGNPGEHDDNYYDVLCATPSVQKLLKGPQKILISKMLQDYLCGFFQSSSHLIANEHIVLGAHQHSPPMKEHWKHTDFNIVSFLNKPRKEGYLNLWEEKDCRYTDDTKDAQPQTIKVSRYIACIYFLNNPGWQFSDGGETGIYSGFQKEVPLIGKVAPIDNSLFFFEINPLSFHCAQGTNKIRNSLIWWYHCSPAEQVLKNQRLSSIKKQLHDSDLFEWWSKKGATRWSYLNDPNYSALEKYYGKK